MDSLSSVGETEGNGSDLIGLLLFNEVFVGRVPIVGNTIGERGIGVIEGDLLLIEYLRRLLDKDGDIVELFIEDNMEEEEYWLESDELEDNIEVMEEERPREVVRGEVMGERKGSGEASQDEFFPILGERRRSNEDI